MFISLESLLSVFIISSFQHTTLMSVFLTELFARTESAPLNIHIVINFQQVKEKHNRGSILA
ncbi:hypothetical protein C6Y40_12050 [Alteromonas alba]|uniref:Uncharacterized protein n=1 Tax=Alteromonas alba TaxID=2079529 RepID=A0A2S9VA82_9ALTE|nr:hypothetical protein [Alteromonadaceae bacterium]PRO73342.1 hypothetical protein C6Y40_12050 [Alteromonas alba]